MKFCIYKPVMSLNQVNSFKWVAQNSRSKRGRYLYGRHVYRQREAWVEEMYEPPKGWNKETRKLVTLTRVMSYRQRPFDDDNLIGGLKPVRDALIDAGYIRNDDSSAAEFVYKQEKDVDGEPRLRVEIVDHPG